MPPLKNRRQDPLSHYGKFPYVRQLIFASSKKQMISIEHLSVEFSARPLFSDACFVVNKRDRIALVGKNGAGKSTMLKIIAGEQSPTSGTVALQRDVSVGYLPQVMVLSDDTTLLAETEKAFGHIHELQTHVEALRDEMATRTDYDSASYMELVEAFSRESERLELMGAQNYRAEIERTLQGLGFERSDFERPTREFSGGWRMRIELAKLLLARHDVLLLDEPTNHLDIESIRWLEQFLARSGAAIILVSHDRAFINNVTQRTLEISCGKVIDYRVPYNEYVRLRAERREAQLRAYENQQKEMADIRDFIERFRYKPTKAVQVQSRIKQLEKMVPIEIDEVDNASLHLKFPPCQRSGDFPIICEGVEKRYGEHLVFNDVNLRIRRGEKVAFVGRNGEGKSTLVKCIMGEIPFDGTLTIGHGVKIGYYAQNQAQMLDENITVFDTIDYVARGDVRLKIRDILGAFMFGGEASEKKVKVLSGGERSRLAMIRLLLEPMNLLILDEPTNHLDMRTKDVLKEAILAFDGTVIIVSHDREFLDGLVTKVYEFGGGKVREHIGGIYDFLQKKDIDTLDALHTLQEQTRVTPPGNTNGHSTLADKPAPSEGALSYAEQKEQARQRRKLEQAVKDAEKRIEDLEEAIADIEARLSTPEGAADTALCTQYGTLKKELEEAEEAWSYALDAMEQQ